jgi:hypothetical protein
MKLCKACRLRPPYKEGAIYCDDADCRRRRDAARKRAERARAKEREERGWKAVRSRSPKVPVFVIPGPKLEVPAMSGDTTQSCRCGLRLRAPSGNELLAAVARHDNVCLVLRHRDHWSVQTMLGQKARPTNGAKLAEVDA